MPQAAVQHYSEILYHENRDSGLRFCCVCPPTVATPLWRQAEATVVPKLPSKGETLTPDQVIDEVELCLELGKPFAYPGKQTKFGVIMRRLFPRGMEGIARCRGLLVRPPPLPHSFRVFKSRSGFTVDSTPAKRCVM